MRHKTPLCFIEESHSIVLEQNKGEWIMREFAFLGEKSLDGQNVSSGDVQSLSADLER